MARQPVMKPSMSDAAVKARTARTGLLVAALDRAGAAHLITRHRRAALGHPRRTRVVAADGGGRIRTRARVARPVTKRERVFRGGFRTLATSLPKLYSAAASDATRADGSGEIRGILADQG